MLNFETVKKMGIVNTWLVLLSFAIMALGGNSFAAPEGHYTGTSSEGYEISFHVSSGNKIDTFTVYHTTD